MTREEIYNAVEQLSQSQGLYCRVLQEFNDHPEVLNILEAENFKDVLDLIMYFEQ